MLTQGGNMQRGYVLADMELNKVVCINDGKDNFTLLAIAGSKSLNRALCFNNITAAKAIQGKIIEFDSNFPEIRIINVAQLYNNFM